MNWYPWGPEAFATAEREQRPIFLSIGYSTCHWCHVMEAESFVDEAIAAFLNQHYVAIKVDREERPDIDAVYMRAASALGGGGGWPLSVWLTPEREPFFAGTYFPPHAGWRGGGAGLLEILTQLLAIYRNELPRVRGVGRRASEVVRASLAASAAALPSGPTAIEHEGPALVGAAVAACGDAFDERHGGLRAPHKFPSHLPIRLLLRHHQRTGDAQALHMAVRTLEAMAAGGIYDQLAGGFHRYATDPAWRLPHFEKMLYDNALLVVAYAEAWQVTRQPVFARVAAETCDELLATFAAPAGGFYSATDADSEGEEGKYFAWTEAEIRAVLGAGAEYGNFLRYFGVSADHELPAGSVLYEASPDEATRQGLASSRAKLLAARRRRVPPLRDEKILAAWNGLVVSAFALAGRVLAQPRYLDAAARAADFVLRELRDPETGGLARSHCAGRRGGPGFLDDHAFVTAGLLDLFESTGEPRWFDEACTLAEATERHFADSEGGGWFLTGPEHERLLAREKPAHDGAEPAGSSVALMNAARLAVLTDSERWRKVVVRALAWLWPRLAADPLSLAEALLAVDFWAGPVREVVVAGVEGAPANGFASVLRDTFCPRKVVIAGAPGSDAWRQLLEHIPLLRDKTTRAGRPVAYVCTAGSCRTPTHEAEAFRRQLVGAWLSP